MYNDQGPPLKKFIACLLFAGVNMTDAARLPQYAPDRFGYELVRSPDCQHQWIDASTQSLPIELQAAGAEPATDEGGAVITLNQDFDFYSLPYRQVVVSSNGYLSFNSSLEAENGADFSNDCKLPAVPENGASGIGRIAILHDDLEAGTDAGIYAVFFDVCPRAGAIADEACTVIQWQHWAYHRNPGADLNFEVILYHQSQSLAFQYQDVASIDTQSATLGMQAASLQSVVNVGCNTTQLIPSHGAWCLNHPRPAEVFIDNGFEFSLE
jgi:hypothetical protein